MAVLIVVIILSILYVFVLARPDSTRTDVSRIEADYAHRGLHGLKPYNAPENSLAAFGLAADSGYGIELDVQLTADGEVVVFHDYSLKRVTGRDALVSELTLAELRELRLINSDGVPTDEKIPLFSEVLSLVGGRVPILVELKGESADCALCPKADAILSAYKGDYCVESFNPLLLGWYADHRPEVYRGLLYTNVLKSKGFSPLNLLLTCMLLNRIAKPQFIAYDEACRRSVCVKLCTDLFKAQKFTWTIRSEESYRIAKSEKTCAIFELFLPK